MDQPEPEPQANLILQGREGNNSQGKMSNADRLLQVYCLQALKPDLPVKTVLDCVNGDLGNKLMHANAQQTQALDPPHQYVPWLVINGKHDDDLQTRAQKALFNLVCELYKGEKPEACTGKGVTPLKKESVCLN